MDTTQHKLKIIDNGPYSGVFLNMWDDLCLRGIRIFSYPLDSFLSCFISTTKELKKPFRRYMYVLIALPIWALCALLAFPFGVLFLLLWLPISGLRKPYRFSYVKNSPLMDRTVKTSYTCVTSNVCIMDEVLARFNNQQDSSTRAREIGRRIATQQLGLRDEYLALVQKNLMDVELQKLKDEKLLTMGVRPVEAIPDDVAAGGMDANRMKSKSSGSIQKPEGSRKRKYNTISRYGYGQTPKPTVDHSILTEFPNVDFLCLQETWQLWCSRSLIKELHKVFPYVVYDVRVDSPSSNMFMLNSGTMIASRYPIIDISFNFFKHSYRQCRLASKGVLQAKVSLGITGEGKRVTGYISNTHLQTYQGTYPLHKHQMDDIVRWTNEFRLRNQIQDEVVAFDIVCGDFNADNMSAGTEMRQTPLDDPLIQTPLGLQMALRHPYLLQQYVINADIVAAVFKMAVEMPPIDQDGNVILSPVGGKRRIDVVLYRKGDAVKVTSCNAVTQLAGLTDHIPYSLTFNINI